MANTKESYNNIEVTDEEISSLEIGKQTTVSETPKDATDEVVESDVKSTKEETPKAVTNPEGSDGDFEYQLEVDGKSYSVDDVVQWKKDADNKSEWSKSNTEKAQKIAGVGKFLKKFNDDEKFQEHLKGYFEDEKEFDSYGLRGNDVIEPKTEEKVVEQVDSNPLEERLNRLEDAENTRIVDQRTDNLEQELSSLEEQYPNILGTPEKVMDFLDFSERNSARYRDTNGVIKLSDVFREYSFDAMQEELSHYKKLDNNKQKNDGSVVNRSEIGAKETQTPKVLKSWNDIDPNDKDFKEYFNE